jgi:hypothetical protein
MRQQRAGESNLGVNRATPGTLGSTRATGSLPGPTAFQHKDAAMVKSNAWDLPE